MKIYSMGPSYNLNSRKSYSQNLMSKKSNVASDVAFGKGNMKDLQVLREQILILMGVDTASTRKMLVPTRSLSVNGKTIKLDINKPENFPGNLKLTIPDPNFKTITYGVTPHVNDVDIKVGSTSLGTATQKGVEEMEFYMQGVVKELEKAQIAN